MHRRVAGQDALDQRGAAARHADHEDRRARGIALAGLRLGDRLHQCLEQGRVAFAGVSTARAAAALAFAQMGEGRFVPAQRLHLLGQCEVEVHGRIVVGLAQRQLPLEHRDVVAARVLLQQIRQGQVGTPVRWFDAQAVEERLLGALQLTGGGQRGGEVELELADRRHDGDGALEHLGGTAVLVGARKQHAQRGQGHGVGRREHECPVRRGHRLVGAPAGMQNPCQLRQVVGALRAELGRPMQMRQRQVDLPQPRRGDTGDEISAARMGRGSQQLSGQILRPRPLRAVQGVDRGGVDLLQLVHQRHLVPSFVAWISAPPSWISRRCFGRERRAAGYRTRDGAPGCRSRGLRWAHTASPPVRRTSSARLPASRSA